MMEGLDNRNGRASLRQSISKSAPKLWSGFGRWIALWAIILAIFGCSGGSGCSSCGGTSEDGSTSSGLGCSSAADPTAPPSLNIVSPTFNPSTANDATIRCDLCDTLNIRLNRPFMDVLNNTLEGFLVDPTTKEVVASLITDLMGSDGDALFEFVFGLDPFLQDMCISLFIEDNDGDDVPLTYNISSIGLTPDVGAMALKIAVGMTNLSLDFRFKAPEATDDEKCAKLDSSGNGIPSPSDPSKFVPDPTQFVQLDTDAQIPNLDITLLLRPLAGDPSSFGRHNVVMCPDIFDQDQDGDKRELVLCKCPNATQGKLCPAEGIGGTWLALELPSIEFKAGLKLQLVAPPGSNKVTDKFSRLLPFLELNLGAKLTNAVKDDLLPYFGPTPLINISDMLGGLAGGSSSGSEGSSCGCSLVGRETTANDLSGLLPLLGLAAFLMTRRRPSGRRRL